MMNDKKNATAHEDLKLSISACDGDFTALSHLMMDLNFQRDILVKALGTAAEYGHLHYCNLLLMICDFRRKELMEGNYPVFCRALGGSEEVSKMFSKQLQYTRDEVARKDGLPLVCAIESGNLSTVKWLVETYNFTREEIRDPSTAALYVAAGESALEILKWFHEKFTLTASDFKGHPANGATKKWIEETFASDDQAECLKTLNVMKQSLETLSSTLEALTVRVKNM